MADENRDPVQGEEEEEEETLEPDISDEALNHHIDLFLKDGFGPLPDFPNFLQELTDSEEAPQPLPRAPEHPQSQGKVEKSSVISKVDEITVAEVDGKVPELDDEVPTCSSALKASNYVGATEGKAGVSYSAKNTNFTTLGGDNGVLMWSSCPKTNGNMGESEAAGVPTSATSHQEYISTSSDDSAVPMNATVEAEEPAITSANPSPEPQGARTGSQAMNYIAPSAVSEMNSIPALQAPSPQMSCGTVDFSNQGGTQASNTLNTVPGNGSIILITFSGTKITLPSNMCNLVTQSSTDNGTTGGGVPPNPMVGTQLMSNQPSTSKIDFKQNTAGKIKGKEEELDEEEENAGMKWQEENKSKRRRYSRKQTEEEEEEEKKKRAYEQDPSDDPEQERRRRDALRAKKVRDRKKNRMVELETENAELKEEKGKDKEQIKRLEIDRQKDKEEIDRLRRENQGLTAQVQGWKTWAAELLAILRERFSIVISSGTPGQGPLETSPMKPIQ